MHPQPACASFVFLVEAQQEDPEMDGKTIRRSHRNPPVGRSSELEMLRQLLFVPQRGAKAMLIGQKHAPAIPLDTLRKPQYMVLMGEAGIGKTRLAEETSREAHERGWAVAWSRSYAQESTIPYRLWIEVLRSPIHSDPWQKQELQACRCDSDGKVLCTI